MCVCVLYCLYRNIENIKKLAFVYLYMNKSSSKSLLQISLLFQYTRENQDVEFDSYFHSILNRCPSKSQRKSRNVGHHYSALVGSSPARMIWEVLSGKIHWIRGSKKHQNAPEWKNQYRVITHQIVWLSLTPRLTPMTPKIRVKIFTLILLCVRVLMDLLRLSFVFIFITVCMNILIYIHVVKTLRKIGHIYALQLQLIRYL